MQFLRQNINTKGRIFRGIGALALSVGAALVWGYSITAGIALSVSAVFVAFEALRGWCALRACGVRTKF